MQLPQIEVAVLAALASKRDTPKTADDLYQAAVGLYGWTKAMCPRSTFYNALTTLWKQEKILRLVAKALRVKTGGRRSRVFKYLHKSASTLLPLASPLDSPVIQRLRTTHVSDWLLSGDLFNGGTRWTVDTLYAHIRDTRIDGRRISHNAITAALLELTKQGKIWRRRGPGSLSFFYSRVPPALPVAVPATTPPPVEEAEHVPTDSELFSVIEAAANELKRRLSAPRHDLPALPSLDELAEGTLPGIGACVFIPLERFREIRALFTALALLKCDKRS